MAIDEMPRNLPHINFKLLVSPALYTATITSNANAVSLGRWYWYYDAELLLRRTMPTYEILWGDDDIIYYYLIGRYS